MEYYLRLHEQYSPLSSITDMYTTLTLVLEGDGLLIRLVYSSFIGTKLSGRDSTGCETENASVILIA